MFGVHEEKKRVVSFLARFFLGGTLCLNSWMKRCSVAKCILYILILPEIDFSSVAVHKRRRGCAIEIYFSAVDCAHVIRRHLEIAYNEAE